MQSSVPGVTTVPGRASIWSIFALTVAGFALTLLVFFPGIMTTDASFVYQDTFEGFRGDWQSPVMTELWALIDPISPGAGSMFLLVVALYWLAFGLIAVTLARHSPGFAILLLALAAMPPASFMLGFIWRDVLFGSSWLLAAALSFASVDRPRRFHVPLRAMALCLIAFGVLLRPNALLAAPILCAYVFWPDRFYWKRTAIIFLPAAIALFVLMQLVYYAGLHATRQHPLQSIMVFDLGGISHFTGQNQLPGTWTTSESALITTGCYKPTTWGLYWVDQPCRFVMEQLEREALFGTSAIVDAWRHAVLNNPVAYMRHRIAFMWNFLATANSEMSPLDVESPSNAAVANRPAFNTLSAIHDMLNATPLFRSGAWLLVCIAVCMFGWQRRDTMSGAYAIGVCGSAAVYMLSFLVFGVASDFRYAYWAVLAGVSGAIVVASHWRTEADGLPADQPFADLPGERRPGWSNA